MKSVSKIVRIESGAEMIIIILDNPTDSSRLAAVDLRLRGTKARSTMCLVSRLDRVPSPKHGF